VLSQHLDTRHDAVLAERKTANAMVARRAERSSAVIALHDRRVSHVVSAIHQFTLQLQFSSQLY
jgi:hypothetical protein